MGRFRSRTTDAGRLAVTARTALAVAGAAIAMASCIDPATNSTTETTLTPLVAPSYVTLAPATSTTLPGESTTTTAPPNVAGTTAITILPPSTEPATTPASAPSSTSVAASGGGTYTVAANDTVYGIARKHGISADALADLNGWSDGSAHSIYPGDKVTVPDGATATTAAAGAATSTSAATASTVPAGTGATYVVVEGDYLSLIAKKNVTTIDAIVKANGWADGTAHLIVVGQTIKLPAKG